MTDLQALALAKSIRFAAGVIGTCMILLGLMIWQPWASPSLEKVPYGSGGDYTRCVTYKDSVDCSYK